MTDIIMWDSPEAATPHIMDGWLSRDGYWYAEERTARYAGCTHSPCESCGTPTPKMYTKCADCRARAELARYEARPEAPWDGKQMVYSWALDRYYSSPDDAWDDEDACDVAELRLGLCEPNYVRQLDVDDFADELPDDGEAPDALLEAIDMFNAAVNGIVLSWSPGKYRLTQAGET